MKKNLIALLLAVVMASGCIGSVPVLAAETTAQESVTVEEDTEGVPAETTETIEDVSEGESVENVEEEPEQDSTGSAEASETVIAEETEITEDAEEDDAADIADTSAEIAVEEEANIVTTITSGEMDIQKESKEAVIAFAGGNGTAEDPYKIETAEQLDAVRNDLNACYVLISDIDLSGKNWEPIADEWNGTKVLPFKGEFDGNNHVIANMTIHAPNTSKLYGLFGLNAGKLRNIDLKDCDISLDLSNASGDSNYILSIGSIAGVSERIITNCRVSGSIKLENALSANVGGIVGYGEATYSTNSIDITINSAEEYWNNSSYTGQIYCGGIVGESSAVNGIITNCINYGSINTESDYYLHLGGISGEYGAIKKCVNYGSIVGRSISKNKGWSSFAAVCNVGGIIGSTSSNTLNDCVNFGDISGKGESSCYVGGIAGWIGYYGNGTIKNCYNVCNDISSSGKAARVAATFVYASELYSIDTTLVNGAIPTEEIGTSLINGENMSLEDIKISISDILDECGCEWVEQEPTTSTIIAEDFSIPDDVLNFENSVADIGVKAGAPYPIDDGWYIYFQNHGFTSSEVASIIKDTFSFGGVCAGMSTVVMQNYKQMLELNDIQSNARVLNDLTKPADSENIRTFIGINHYGMLSPGYSILQDDFMNQYKDANALQYLYNLAADIENTNKLIYLDYWYCEDIAIYRNDKNDSDGWGAHAVVVYGMETSKLYYNVDGERYKYRLLAINPNHLYKKDDSAADYTIYLSENLDKCIITSSGTMTNTGSNEKLNYCGNMNNIKSNNDFVFQYITNDVNKLLPVGRSKETNSDKYYVWNGTYPWIYVNTNGQKLSSSTSVHGLSFLPHDVEGGQCSILLEKGDYTFETEIEGEFSLFTGESYIEFNSTSGGSVQITDDSTVTVNSPSQFSVSITSDQLPVTNEDIVSFSIDGENVDNLQIDYSNGNGIKLSGDVAEGTRITCESIDKETTYSYTAEDDKSDIIVNADDEIQIADDNTIVASGTCGDNLAWSFNEQGTLIISGSGDMYNYPDLDEWNNINYDIKKIVIKNGVTSIGEFAFNAFPYLTEVIIPPSVKSIGHSAFWLCSSLESIVIPEGVEEIGDNAFDTCSSLKSVTIPKSTAQIGSSAFNNCKGVTIYYAGSEDEWEKLNVDDYFLTVKCAIKSIYNTEITGITDKTYDGNALVQNPIIKHGDNILVLDKDYTLSYRNNVNAGMATIIINGIGDYTGTVEIAFIIRSAEITPTVSLSGNTFTFTGAPIKPSVTVSYNGKQLKEGVDYNLAYKNNVEPGTASVIVTCIGNYSGSVTKEFTINKEKVLTGAWKKTTSGWWYDYGDGSYPKSKFENISGKTYYFNSSGYMVTGWQNIGGKWYYFSGSGAMLTGWQSIGGKWYYMSGSGVMQTDWQKIDGKTYYFSAGGAMATGWQKINNKWYYFSGSGAMLTGWQKISNKWYYFDANGAMMTGWQSIGGKWYYFEGSGAMAANKWVGNYYLTGSGAMATNTWIGKYYVGADGKWIPNYKAAG